MRDAAYAASSRTGARKRRVPAVRRRQVPAEPHCASRLPQDAEGADPRDGLRNSPPAVDRADRDDLAGVRCQRIRRHRAHVLVDLHPQEAHARRQQAGIRRRGLRLSPYCRRMGGDENRLPAGSSRARDERARPHADDRGRAAVRRCRDQQDRQRAGGLPVRGLQEPVPRGVERRAEGHHDLSAEQRDRLGARSRQGAGGVAQRLAAGPEG